ncbi:MAG TPA: FAD-dependent oxidoreductase [Iamia sp.]
MTVAARPEVTVVGGGVAGLIAAVEAAEAGAPVRLLEARRRLGGRATSTPGPFVANLGPHALYVGTELWGWLVRRDLAGRAVMPRSPHVRFRWEGSIRRLPPRALLPALRLRGVSAPVDADLRTWATERWGPASAAALAGVAGALTFDHDPGRLSAAFVVERIQRIFLRPTVSARYVEGGWSALAGRVAAHARSLGVRIELDAGIDPSGLADRRAAGPVVLAVEPGAARRLLGDEVAPAPRRRVALLDVGLARARDPYVVVDLDEAIFWTRPSAVLDGLAPEGADIVQLSGGMTPGETLDAAEARLEAVLDAVSPGWRTRVEWRRRAAVTESTGAVDLPGATWRDRPAITRGDGLWLAGDWVASPGHLAEVSCTSAVTAARLAVAALSGVSGVSGVGRRR